MRYFIRLVVLLSCALASLATASAEKRVALVIGNADYKVGRLANPVNDATAVAEALEKQLKFDKVLLRKNLDAQGFRAALLELSRETTGADVVAVYFAGHGIELGGKNYLIPVDATLAKASTLALEAIPLEAVSAQLDGVTRLKLVILDACRNNPFLGEKRGGSRGLARFEPEGNSLIAYAAKDGTAADDGSGAHSPYTAALLKHIATPGLEINLLFRRVRTDVLAATGGAQQPAEYHSLGDKEIFLVPPASAAGGGAPVQPAPAPAVDAAAQAWTAVKDSTIIAQLEAIVRRFPGTVYADFATARIEALKKQQTAMLNAEEDRKRAEEEARKQAAMLKAEQDRRRAEDEKKGAEAELQRPGRVFRDCSDVCPEMVVVPAGHFMMGSNGFDEGKPPHSVAIVRPFAVGKFEVMFAEWDACVAAGGCAYRPEDAGWGRGKQPVINVSWNDITKEYLPWLSRKTGKTYRLLTEAEWEYVARAGTSTAFWWGPSISTSQANYNGNFASGVRYKQGGKTVPVDSFVPNPWGLYNVHGNVWEWVQDCWNDSYYGAPTEGSPWLIGDCALRVVRGGSWYSNMASLSAVNRGKATADVRDDYSGFRVARTL